MTAPAGSVIETIVLLNVDLMWAWPSAMFFFSLRRGLRAAVLGAAMCGSPESCGAGGGLARLLLAGDGALGTLARAGVGLRALAAHREAATVADALVGADLDLAADVGGDLAAEVTLHLVGLDVVAKGDELIVGQVLDANVGADVGGLEDLDGAS